MRAPDDRQTATVDDAETFERHRAVALDLDLEAQVDREDVLDPAEHWAWRRGQAAA